MILAVMGITALTGRIQKIHDIQPSPFIFKHDYHWRYSVVNG